MTKFQWKKRITKEFGRPVEEVIRQHNNRHFSKNKTAMNLGINIETLNKFCKEHQIEWCQRKDFNQLCKARPTGSSNNPWGCKGKPI